MAAKKYNVNPQMQKIGINAVIAAKNKFNVILDFTENSLKQLELLLRQADESYKKATAGGYSRTIPIENTVRVWGSYLGEVIRRSLGGEWIVDKQAVYIQIGYRKLSPLDQVRSRIEEGPLFNVENYFQRLKSEIQKNIEPQPSKEIVDRQLSQTLSGEKRDPKLPKWEYMFIQQNNFPIANGVYVVSTSGKRVRQVKGHVTEGKLIESLNFFGESGWEVIDVRNKGIIGAFRTVWTLKRVKTIIL